MKVDDFHFPEDLFFDSHHQWTRVEGDEVVIGLTDYAQSNAGDVVFVDLPRPGAVVRQGQPFGSIESGKWVGRLYAPVGGTVIEANDRLAREPRLINQEPYAAGWIVRIKPDDLSELNVLMRSESARALVASELENEVLDEASLGENRGES